MSNSCDASVESVAVDLVGFLVACDGVGRLRLFGELDVSEVPRLRACLDGAAGDVELDCSGLRFIDAAGLGLFVQLDNECRARGGTLLIVNPSRCVIRLMELTGLDSLLTAMPGNRPL
jgi:anti-anti-sigma factor